MNVTLLISEIFPPRHGGSGRWFVELYGRLPRDEYLVAAGTTEGDTVVDNALASQLRTLRLPLSCPSWGLRSITGLKFYFQSFRKLSRVIRENNVNHIHCGRCLPEGVLGWLLSKRFGIPYLCFVHGEDIQTAADSRELSWLVRNVLSGSTGLIANSHNTKHLLIDHWKVASSKISVLHPGMDAVRFTPAAPDAEFLSRMNWTDREVVLTVGRLQRRKGQDMLIRALPELIVSHPNLLYVMIGDGEEREGLEELAESLDVKKHVSFMSNIDDETMIQCYQQCMLFALPNRTEGSDIEGFGMVLAEAQACGKPVLAGDSGGTRETMIVGETGVIADCTTPEKLASTLDLLLKDRERLSSMGARGRQHVSDKFDWPVHVSAARKIFEAL